MPVTNSKPVEHDVRWAAIAARDTAMDGQFYYSVRTTGVYCRPSCGARMPKPENVQFHETCKQAEQAGFRPCKRCRPDRPALAQEHAAIISTACRFIEDSEITPSLEVLSARAGLSTWYFHRLFKAATGLTPKGYAAAHKSKQVRKSLAKGGSVTEAILDAGYGSNSRFYEKSNHMLGMTPTSYRAGGANTDIRFAVGECSLGSILVASSERGVCAILLGDDPDTLPHDLQDMFPKSSLIGGDNIYEELVARVVGFVETPTTDLDLPLDIRGTAFQHRVWQALCEIPPGATMSYTDIARKIGAPTAIRAVAGACATNRLAVAIPCHRVVRSDGNLSGYRWGVERKRALLKREKDRKS